MRVGIVGSRRCTNRNAVESLVWRLPEGTVVVSGGAKGPDKWAEIAAKARRLDTLIFLPDLGNVRHRGEVTRRYYERNQTVVDHCDVLHAFVSEDRKGGTEDTIRRAQAKGIDVIIHLP